ncbi:MAG: oxidoreductase domain protein [Bryobacterales bacterium]|nr:oxidoreductase domain protein [Bryobacterales bacterium]
MKAAVLGGGFMGRVHAEALRRLGSVEPIPVGGRDEAAFRAALANPAIKAFHICTPNAAHFRMAKAALEAGKHVLCEKPLATSASDARTLADLAREKRLRNCTCHNLRYYPMVQHMRRMREDGDLGEILIVQGTYSQDWLLYDTDWNWRVDSKESGPSRALADIGSHWCDMAEHVTGQRITSLCADLQTFHKARDTEDFGAVIFRVGDRARGTFTASQVSAGRKNRLSIEIYGTKSGVAWDQERPDELWIGNRNTNNQLIIKDPALLKEGARSYADLPGGHSEGYDDTFKQLFRRFYASIENPGAKPEYPDFADGLRQLIILEAELESNRRHAWEHVR